MQAKRWLSGLVACAMLVTMLPTQVFALESDAADTWSKTLNAEELYALIQDKLDENGSIGLADLADSEAGTDTNDGVQGTLTAVAFDSGDKIELSALADGDTSYTLTFTDDDTSEPDSGLPAETGDMTEPPQEDGQPVAPGATPADDSTASDTTSGTDPPTAEEPSAQGQEGTVDLRVTTQETYATEAEADAQAAEQGKDPEADVAVQTDEATGTVLGAMLTVDEEQVDAVTLYYTADEAEDVPAAQPDNAISTMRRPDQPEYSETYTINVGESETIEGEGWYTDRNHQWKSSDSSVVSVDPNSRNPSSATITGESVGTATITHTWKGVFPSKSHVEQFLVTVNQKEDEWVTFDVYYLASEKYPDP
ncbi:MAG TPA: Ig-like domain-containing protein, partial [Candidatus Butyricicoccus avicola]|nr:Ig-like domain-containing protein [Candidatus Butyricicoccus avicola]